MNKSVLMLIAFISFSAQAETKINYSCNLGMSETQLNSSIIQVELGKTTFGMTNYLKLEGNSYIAGIVSTNLDGTIKNAGVALADDSQPQNQSQVIAEKKDINMNSFSISGKLANGTAVTFSCSR